MLQFTEEDVRRMLPMTEAIECMRKLFPALVSGAAQNQVRRRMFLPSGAVLHSMAGAYDKYFGTKIYSTHPRFGAHFTFLLYDAATAKLLAEFEANYLGQIRTGAVSGFAAETLTPPGEARVGLIGSGFQAHSQLEAMLVARPVTRVRVWSPKEERRLLFAADWRDRGVEVEAVSTAQKALENADIVITATFAKEPVLEGEWLTANAFIAAVGSNHPQRREIPEDIVRGSRVVVDDIEAARVEAGDLLLGGVDWSSVERLGAAHRGCEGDRNIRRTLFKSVGLGAEDVAVAASIYERYS